MTLLDKRQLFSKVTRSIQDCGWQIIFLSDLDQHPLRLNIFKDDESYLVRIYIWNITHGGGQLRPPDEYRIQITGVSRFEPEPDGKTIILGWWNEAEVFAGFDYRRHSGLLGASPSMQIREQYLREAYENGFSPCNKGNQEIAIAFRPDFIVEYIRSLEHLHDFGEIDSDFEVLSSVAKSPEAVSYSDIEKVSVPRRKTIASVSRAIRDNSFRQRVLTAYSYKCAVCGLQLDLVEAAHIVPVAHEKSSDETSNGLSLCVLHHKAYDRALITIDEKYHVLFNEFEIKRLEEIGHDDGKQNFLDNLRALIILPPAGSDRPKPEYLRIGKEIRAFQN